MDDPRTYYWNLLLVHPLERALQFLATDVGLGAGIAIIVFTILMRLVLLPLTIQQYRSQKAMSRLQPELKELQRKFGTAVRIRLSGGTAGRIEIPFYNSDDFDRVKGLILGDEAELD